MCFICACMNAYPAAIVYVENGQTLYSIYHVIMYIIAMRSLYSV